MKNYQTSIVAGDLVKLEGDDLHIYRVDFVENGEVYATSITDVSRGVVRAAYMFVWA